jgi:DNA-binding transcriptional ArsR family regulator
MIIFIYIHIKVNMPTIKPEILEKSSEMLKAIAHPVRIMILQHLYDNQKLTVSQLIQKTGVEQSLISHNLRIMKDRGILNVTRQSKNAIYELRYKKLYEIVECVVDCCRTDQS